jgi:Predicted glycosyl transferase
MNKKVFFYVQHLLGIGHLKRASILSNELQKNNFEVYLISGGMPVPNLILNNLKLIQLPPIKALNGDFNQIVDKNNILVDKEFFLKRSNLLLELFIKINPDILIIEMYPFGRKSIELELENLLIKVKNINQNIFVLTSVRDILIKKKKISRYKEMLSKFNKYFDYVLVHSDEKIISFDNTFPLTNKIQTKLFHTGYVVDNLSRSNFERRNKEIIVSAGGGAVGKKILKTAI